MNGFEHMADFADLCRRHMAENIAVKMNHAPLPACLGQILRDALKEAAAGIGNDQLNAFETAVDEMTQKRRPAGFVFLGALTDAENLPKSFRIDSTGHQQRDIADLARPAALHHDPIQIQVRMLALDAPVPPGFDLGVDLLVEVRHLTRVPQRASVMSSTRRTETPARYISIS